MHQAIKDNIEYWMRQSEALAQSPPFHTSYYCVESNQGLVIYGVKWHGADLWKGEVFTPDNWADLLEGAARAASEAKRNRHGFGDYFESGGKLMTADCFILDGPVRRRDKWGMSMAGSLLHAREVGPFEWGFRLDKSRHQLRFIDETEGGVVVLVAPKD